jgi:hypothetical protein
VDADIPQRELQAYHTLASCVPQAEAPLGATRRPCALPGGLLAGAPRRGVVLHLLVQLNTYVQALVGCGLLMVLEDVWW